MKLAAILMSVMLGQAAFATQTALNCKGNIALSDLVMNVKLQSNSELISAKAFYLVKGEKPVFAGGIGAQVGKPGKKNPSTTIIFSSDDDYGDSTTLYLPNNLSQYVAGETVRAVVLFKADGVEPQLAKFTCTVKR